MYRLIFVQLLFSITIPQMLFAAVPDIGDNSLYVCLEQEDELGCYGDIYRLKKNGSVKRLTLSSATAQAKQRIKSTRDRRKLARSGDNTQRVESLRLRILALKAAREDFSTCWNYDDPDCTGSGGQGGNQNVAAACEVVQGSPSSENLEATQKYYSRIVNGAICTRGDSPVIPVIANGQNFCTGSLIAPNIVLTAAHCVVGFDCSRFSVQSGTGDTQAVTSCEVHPNYDQHDSITERNDVALLFLEGDLDARTTPIYTTNDFSVGETVITTGYGRNEDDDANLRATFNQLSEVTNVGLATEYQRGNINEGTTCNGDSGGPLFIERDGEWYLIGVVSWGTATDCALPGTSPSRDEGHWANVTSIPIINFLADQTDGVVD